MGGGHVYAGETRHYGLEYQTEDLLLVVVAQAPHPYLFLRAPARNVTDFPVRAQTGVPQPSEQVDLGS